MWVPPWKCWKTAGRNLDSVSPGIPANKAGKVVRPTGTRASAVVLCMARARSVRTPQGVARERDGGGAQSRPRAAGALE
ncbi:MAG: hypothetical protein DHS20C21_09350 [Gemmatimonadota bacterium]|nr:MAG: hypothetical protein DHS20C21_09350 [Gemmatimonadota bacterium]